MLDQLYSLLAERDELKFAENTFKARYREELVDLDKKIYAMNMENHSGVDQMNPSSNLKETELKATLLYNELATLNKEILHLIRLAGISSSQVEMAQYQRRFVELCNQC